MPYLFDGVQELIINANGDWIKGVKGYHGEVVKFKKAIGRGVAWVELKQIRDALAKVVAWELNIAGNKSPAMTFGKVARMLVEETFGVQEALAKK